MRFCHIIPLLYVLLLATGCSHADHCPRLDSVDALCETDPSQAQALLRTIKPDSLSTDDQHLYDLLTIRVADKLYITHTSDSLITSVLDYYSRHTDSPHHPQALYYAGRVYSDLGDYPTALSYFQQALDALPEDTDRNGLFKRGFILSQTARLLHNIRLYNQAIPLIKESLHIDSILNDSLNLMYDHILAGQIHLYENEFLTAEQHFMNANTIATYLHVEEEGFTNILMAESKLRQQDIASALKYINKQDIITNNGYKNNAYSTLSKIYFYADMPDSAYRYAHLIVSNDSLNDPIGYRMLIASILKKNQTSDSIYSLLSKYHIVLEQKQDESENQATILQNTLYNYQLHDRAKAKALKSKESLARVIYITLSLLAVVIILTVIILYRYRTKQVQYLLAIRNLNELRKELEKEHSIHSANADINTSGEYDISADINLDNLRIQLRKELLNLNYSIEKADISSSIIASDTYISLLNRIESNTILRDNDPLWNDLESIVLSVSNNFKNHLLILTCGQLKLQDYRISLLIKCGIAPSKIAILLGRARNSISTQRESLSIKLLGEKVGTKAIDNIIRYL